jgi:hypothetical protein
MKAPRRTRLHLEPLEDRSLPSVTAVVITNPIGESLSVGQTASFTAAAMGDPAPTVQWQSSGDGGSTFSDIPGATSDTLSFTAQSGDDELQYRAVYTNALGQASTSAGELFVQFGPTITTQPVSVAVAGGTQVSFSAAAVGDPWPALNWQVSKDGGLTFSDILWTGGLSTYSFVAQDFESGWEYRAVYSGFGGVVLTQAATLTVDNILGLASVPTLVTNPATQTVRAGQSVTFTAAATGNPAPTSVQWQVSTDGQTFNDIPGANSDTLSFTTQSREDEYEYRAVFTNAIGQTTTGAAELFVQFGPDITLEPSNVTAVAGSQVSFSAAAIGDPWPALIWQVSTDGGQTFSDIAWTGGVSTYSFVAQPLQSGWQYRAVFEGVNGTLPTDAATLTVADPTILAQGSAQLHTRKGPQHGVIDSAHALRALAGLTQAQLATLLSVPTIDWQTEMVVFVSAGYGPRAHTRGIEITGLSVNHKVLTIHSHHGVSGAHTSDSPAQADPADFILLQRFHGRVHFQRDIVAMPAHFA